MVNRYLKKENKQLTKHFNSKEFDCKCNNISCKETYINLKLVYILESLRLRFGEKIKITSGWRCKNHNYYIGGVNNSFHTNSKYCAVDFIPPSSIPRNKIINHLDAFKVNGMGVYDRFIHIDLRDGYARW